MVKSIACPNCQKICELPEVLSDSDTVCKSCGYELPLTMLSNDESEWYSISEEALHASETVFMNNKPDKSEINPSRPITDFLHGTSGIEKYSVYDEIGRGAMSVILKAADKNIRREIAMKVLPKAAGHEKQARFMEEAQVIGQLEHPNIIPIHDIGVDPEGRPFFTMKLVKGRSLGDILEDLKSGKREAEEEYSRVRLLRSMVAVCNAVAFAHSKGVIHRDLKPDNIMVGDFGEVLVMDWGLARIIAPPKNSSKKLARSARMAAALSTIRRDIGGIGVRDTMDGNIVGTPLYMSPEQARGEVSKVDMRSDIYGLGAILYEIVTLLPPIKGDAVNEVLDEVCAGRIVPPIERVEDRTISSDLNAIIMKALSYSQHNRYQSVEFLRDDINRYIAGFSVSAKSDNFVEAFIKMVKRNKTASLISTVAIIVLIATVTYSYINISQERDRTLSAFEAFKAAQEQKAEAEKMRKKAEEKKKELEQQVEEENRREWHLVFKEDFSDADILKRWIYIGHRWEVKNGELRIFGGTERRLMLKKPMLGDLRIEFDCHIEGEFLNDITCFFSALRGEYPTPFEDYGYIFQFGGSSNSQNSLLKYQSAPLWTEKASPLKKSVRYHVRAQKVGNRLTLYIDDEEIFDIEDKEPLSGPERSGVGLYSWQSDIYYDNIKIYRLSPPMKIDMLDLAEKYMSEGHYQTAIDLFADIIDSSASRVRRQRAIEGKRKTLLQMSLRKNYTKYAKKIKENWSSQNAMLIRKENMLVLELKGKEVKSLDPIKGMYFGELSLSDTNVISLRELNKMPLSKLWIDNTPVESLRGIENLPLNSLILINTKVTDLSPLKKMNLEELVFDIKDIKAGLSIVKNMKSLKKIGVSPDTLVKPKEFWSQVAKDNSE